MPLGSLGPLLNSDEARRKEWVVALGNGNTTLGLIYDF